ncbi:sugar phosphate isomerase/epimerase [Evansella vedderi]|uniref:Sugar phosphate isomerase/epimerase n=1 Tax=Evansella vedderi TaxID=38282 RepID=A0ABT9ZPJ8_9BACI|nr:sugar phosphate isomerase/epimerase [Evansella vedderi]MDQ0253162.1 sugar phosphate isomerase/epimerase [Evansella vedderi]
MAKKQLGIQLYTLREACQEDFVGTLRKVAELGYDGVEFAGYWGGFEAQELKKILGELNLAATGSHVPFVRLEEDLDEIIEFHRGINSNHIICPNLPMEMREDAENFINVAKRLNAIGEKTAANGIMFSYHNHDWELKDHNGKRALDIFLNETNPEWVKAELDVYWLAKAENNPVEWLERYKGRTPLIHLKDMTTDGEQFFAELGAGGIDLQGITKIGAETGVKWWIVEQDQSRRNPLESVETSINYFRRNLWYVNTKLNNSFKEHKLVKAHI